MRSSIGTETKFGLSTGGMWVKMKEGFDSVLGDPLLQRKHGSVPGAHCVSAAVGRKEELGISVSMQLWLVLGAIGAP